jgi:hypothetical protein
METPLPSNQTLLEFSEAVPWQEIERQKRIFAETMSEIASSAQDDHLPVEAIAAALGVPVTTYYDSEASAKGNILLAHYNNRAFMLGSAVSARYRSGKPLAKAIVPYNLNPSVNHTNLEQTEDSYTRIRALGAEVELGLYYPDGREPSEEEVQNYMHTYQTYARKLGITPQVDREACQYQVEVHVAPGVGYHRTRSSLDGIMSGLMATSTATGLKTAIMSAYPIKSDFRLTDDPKVYTAVDLMVEINGFFPEYQRMLAEAKERYQIDPNANVVEVFRNQGTHIHLDLAGRSEALGLLTFYTMLRSVSAIANCAVLKGCPFVNGTCDAELLCTREYLRHTTVTGRYLEMPLSPHLLPHGMEKYGKLICTERVNSMARALLCEEGLGQPISVMHNPIGRVRPDLGTSKRICTVESTGLPAQVSASRMAAVLTDFEYSHALIENYFRKYGCDLEPMYNDKTLWSLLGPLDTDEYIKLQDLSDRNCTDIVLTTAIGEQMTLAEFYEMKRIYLHKHLVDVVDIAPRDIDDVYISLGRMLSPPSGVTAQTIEEYVHSPKLRSTGNWGKILRNAFIEEGGVPGTHNPDAVLRVVNRVHDALYTRYFRS